MKTNIFLAVLTACLVGFQAFAGNIVINDNGTELRVTENTYQKLRVSVTLSEILTYDIQTSHGIFTKLKISGYSHTGLTGWPELPVNRKLIEVPLNAGISINIISAKIKEIDLKEAGIDFPVLPAQLPVPKEGEIPPFEYDEAAYQTDAFYPSEIVTVDLLGFMRGIRIGRLNIAPVQYNPVTGILRVFEELTFEIVFEHADIPLTLQEKRKNETLYFRSVSRQLLNYKSFGSRDTITDYPIKYVIVSDPMFYDQLQPLIEWKTKKGFTVIEAYTDDPSVGNTTFQIKAYLQDLYDNATPDDPPPSFILFVGDVEQIPAWTGNAGGHVTDLFYCEYTGDYFPEVFYGRMSAKTTDHLQPQIDKTLLYEQYTMSDPTYLNEVVMVAGMDAGHGHDWGNGQINYGTENYFNETNGIISHTYLYPESGSHSADIIQDISNGVTFGNYTAHCSPNGWSDPSFTISNIPTLQNEEKYGLLIGNCCSSSEYQQSECFAEELLRAESKGAVGYIGASNSTFWDEDYYFGVGVGEISEIPPPYEETTLGAYDRTWHTHGEPLEDWYTTMDQMVYAGNLAVTEGSPGSAEYYWEAYCLMGDPSLMIYYSEPPEIMVSHMPILLLNTTEFTVNTEAYAYVAISRNGILHGAALADADGLAVVPITPFTTPGMADIVVTKQNGQPYTGTVLANDPEGPYIIVNDFNAIDITGNQNNKVEYGEVIALDVEVKNWGNSDGIDVGVTLFTTDPYITLSDDFEYTGIVPAHDSITLKNAFSFIVDPQTPDEHVVEFEFVIQDVTAEDWFSEIEISVFAPVFSFDEVSIDDSETGNGNGRLDPGEDAEIIVTCSNKGHTIAPDTYAKLIARTGFVNVQDPSQSIGDLGLFGSKVITYPVSVTEEAPEGIIFDLVTQLESGELEYEEIHPTPIGIICEDFETGDFSAFPWNQGGDQPWQITSDFPFEGYYSIRSGAIDALQTSTISLTYMVMTPDSISFYRKVSSEAEDNLQFFINGELMGEWSGTTAGWRRETFPVYAGTKTFTWTYIKNGAGSTGADCAWLDAIVFPPTIKTTLYAGDDDMACGENTYLLNGQATDFSAVEWLTSGTGTFNNNQVLSAVYTPSEDDITNGVVTLTLNVTGNDNSEYSDEMMLGFEVLPDQADSPVGPDYVNLQYILVSEYSTQALPGINSYSWVIEPEEAGVFVGNGEATTIVWSRNFAGEAVITVAGENLCGTGVPSAGLIVTVENIFVRIDEASVNDVNIAIYPIPASSSLNFEFLILNYNSALLIYDVFGRMVEEVHIAERQQQIQINVSDYPNGIYIAVLKDSGNIISSKKFVVSR